MSSDFESGLMQAFASMLSFWHLQILFFATEGFKSVIPAVTTGQVEEVDTKQAEVESLRREAS